LVLVDRAVGKPFPPESQLCSNQIWISATTRYGIVPQEIAEKSIHLSRYKRPTWSPGGRLDWWVKERQQWWGRVRGKDGRQRWIPAVDLRPANSSQQ
jgi:hypothetical protein